VSCFQPTAILGTILPLLAASVWVTGATQAAPASRTVLAGSAPSWAKSQNFVASTDSSTDVGFRVYLGWKDPAAAAALASAVSDPGSRAYGHYLAPTQFRKQFAPDANAVAQVQNWLRTQGFSVQYTPNNGHYISAEGTVAELQAAFGVSFGNYLVRGQIVRAPTADVSIPASLANVVSAVIGLDESYQFVQTQHRTDFNAPPGLRT
jgi:subtilase family serine protease